MEKHHQVHINLGHDLCSATQGAMVGLGTGGWSLWWVVECVCKHVLV